MSTHGPDAAALPVVPVLVIWGKGGGEILEGGVIEDGINIVHGTELRAWLRAQTDSSIPKQRGKQISRALAAYEKRQLALR